MKNGTVSKRMLQDENGDFNRSDESGLMETF
jgi:hypothetical protein